MKSEVASAILIVLFLVVGVATLYVVFSSDPRPKGKGEDPFSPIDEEEPPCAHGDLMMYNYFPRHQVRVAVVSKDRRSVVQLGTIQPNRRRSVNRAKADRALVPGAKVLLYASSGGEDEVKIGEADVTNDIRELHFGQIEIVNIGNQSIRWHMANALSGKSFIVIHNKTTMPLSLNNGRIVIDPLDRHVYKGYYQFGVPLGTHFVDAANRFPPIEYNKPYTDIYYHAISSMRKPLYNGYMYEYYNGLGEVDNVIMDGIY